MRLVGIEEAEHSLSPSSFLPIQEPSRRRWWGESFVSLEEAGKLVFAKKGESN